MRTASVFLILASAIVLAQTSPERVDLAALGRIRDIALNHSQLGMSGPPRVEKTPEYEKFAGYFNLDYGTGRIRGIYAQGNDAVKPIFSAWLAPLKDLGASTVSLENVAASVIYSLAMRDAILPRKALPIR
jgi:hypothetical protein